MAIMEATYMDDQFRLTADHEHAVLIDLPALRLFYSVISTCSEIEFLIDGSSTENKAWNLLFLNNFSLG